MYVGTVESERHVILLHVTYVKVFNESEDQDFILSLCPIGT